MLGDLFARSPPGIKQRHHNGNKSRLFGKVLFDPTLKSARASRAGASGHVEAKQSQGTADGIAQIDDRPHQRRTGPEQCPPAQIELCPKVGDGVIRRLG